MLGGEVHFLLCHHHPGMNTRLDPALFESRCIGRDKLVPVCAGDGAGRPMWPIPGTAGKPTRLLSYSSASGLGRMLEARVADRVANADVDKVFTTHLAATLLAMTRDGLGAAWLPLTMIEEDLRAGRLVRAGDQVLEIDMEIRLFRSPECRNPASDQLWARLGEHVGA